MNFIIGKKVGMSQVFGEDGTVTPVTVLDVTPNIVTQVKNIEKDGYNAVQLGFGARKAKNISKPVLGHLKDLGPFAVLKEFRTEEGAAFERGQEIKVDTFETGEMIDVSGVSIGRGFAGVVKRHGFAGSPATHGHKDQHRMPGSIGAQEPQHVFKGTRMGGHMGAENCTTKNLQVVKIDVEHNQLLVKGAVPGSNGGIVVVVTAKNAKQSATSKEDKK